jgi:hypothetical protein
LWTKASIPLLHSGARLRRFWRALWIKKYNTLKSMAWRAMPEASQRLGFLQRNSKKM